MRTMGVALLALLVAGGSAFAQGQPGKAGGKDGKLQPVQGKKVKNVTFGQGDQLIGEILLPMGDNVVVVGEGTKDSLIRLRVEFVREIVKSTETL